MGFWVTMIPVGGTRRSQRGRVAVRSMGCKYVRYDCIEISVDNIISWASTHLGGSRPYCEVLALLTRPIILSSGSRFRIDSNGNKGPIECRMSA